MALSSAQSLAGITSDGSPRVTEARAALAARRPNGWMKRRDIILAVSNNLYQQDEMNEWKGCEAEDHQSSADGWHASHVKILDIYIFIFIQVRYPGFSIAGVIPMSILLLFPHGVATPPPPPGPLAGPDAWWSSVRSACNVGVLCHAGTGCEVPLTLTSRDWACVGLRKLGTVVTRGKMESARWEAVIKISAGRVHGMDKRLSRGH